ncbi:MAG: HEAT repeat domain-containing protein [Candidatus Riflebacteria bacterium]|nr:HEAT repeat domain-containing protein [Candidatus Riflebacteria bacterium]
MTDPILASAGERLASPEPTERVAAYQDLAGHGSAEAFQLIGDTIPNEADPDIRIVVAQMCGSGRGADAAAVLLRILRDADARVRLASLKGLIQLDDPGIYPAVVQMLFDSDQAVQACAQEALVALGKERVVKLLDRMVDSGKAWAVEAAVMAAGRITLRALIPVLEKAHRAGSDGVKAKAIQGLKNMASRGEPAAQEALARLAPADEPVAVAQAQAPARPCAPPAADRQGVSGDPRLPTESAPQEACATPRGMLAGAKGAGRAPAPAADLPPRAREPRTDPSGSLAVPPASFQKPPPPVPPAGSVGPEADPDIPSDGAPLAMTPSRVRSRRGDSAPSGKAGAAVPGKAGISTPRASPIPPAAKIECPACQTPILETAPVCDFCGAVLNKAPVAVVHQAPPSALEHPIATWDARFGSYFLDCFIGGFLSLIPFGGLVYSLIRDVLGTGQSLGKRPNSLYVIDATTGAPCTLGQSIMRNLFLMLPLINLVEIILVFTSGIRLGDRVAGTRVVRPRSAGPVSRWNLAVPVLGFVGIFAIGILAAIAVPNFKEARNRANRRACYANQKTLACAIEMYMRDKNKKPEEVPEITPQLFNELRAGRYLQSIPEDPGQGPGTAGNYVRTESGIGVACRVHGSVDGTPASGRLR